MSNGNNDVDMESPLELWNIPLDDAYLNSSFNVWNCFNENDPAFFNSYCLPGVESPRSEAQKTDHNQENLTRKQQDSKGKSTKRQKPSASRQNQNQNQQSSNPCCKMSNENTMSDISKESQLESDKTAQNTYSGSSTSEPQETDHNQSESNEARPMQRREKMKRKQQDDAKGKSTKRQKPPASRQLPEPKNEDFYKIIEEKTEDFKKFIDKKSVLEGIKYVSDSFNRRKMADKLADFDELLRPMQIEWPMRPDVKRIDEKIDEIKSDYEKATDKASRFTTEEEEAGFKKRLLEVRVGVEKLKIQERELSTREKNLQAVFANHEVFSNNALRKEGFSNKALRKELFSALPGIVSKETATKEPATLVKDKGSLGTREQLQDTSNNLKNELYAMDNDEVHVSDFEGLAEAVKKTQGMETPEYLELIALRIEKAHRKTTEFSYKGIQVLVCAAIHEMENVPIEIWNWSMLKKWGATLNKAKKLNFRLEFADKLLKNSLFAYLGHSNVR